MHDDFAPRVADKIRGIERLKLQVLDNTNSLLQAMGGSKAASEAVGETLAELILSSYRLAQAVGISHKDMNRRIKIRIKALMAAQPDLSGEDLSALDGKF